MGARILVDEAAVDRLAELGLTMAAIERVGRRADAEASTCTPLDPPIMAGLIRWGRMNRFLREELVPIGWRYDNPRNLPRTIHPSGEFAIVATTGDDATGDEDSLPTTKYLKGYATARAIEANGQLTLDFGDFDFGELAIEIGAGGLATWFLLFRVTDDSIAVELSLPDAIEDGRITSWIERIIFPTFPRQPEPSTAQAQPVNGLAVNGLDDIVVEVSHR